MPISELTIPDRGDRPDPPRPLGDDPGAVAIRRDHVAGEAIVQAIARVVGLAGALLLAVLTIDVGLLANGPGRPVRTLGVMLSIRGEWERTPLGLTPKAWPASPHPDAAALLVGGVETSIAATGSILLALAFGLSRYRAWARLALLAALAAICGLPVAGFLRHHGPTQRPGVLPCFSFAFAAVILLALWSPAARPVFRREYRLAVALSPRLRPWRTGNRLLATLLVALLGVVLSGLIVLGPLSSIGAAQLREALRMTYGD